MQTRNAVKQNALRKAVKPDLSKQFRTYRGILRFALQIAKSGGRFVLKQKVNEKYYRLGTT
jgi:hypothetical protein